MRKALPRAVGVFLAVGAVVVARWALAQAPNLWMRGQQTPVRKVFHEENVVLPEGGHRLEEMKVELALLSDVATFPYYLCARAGGKMLALRGYAPNELVRQRAEELARRSTFLNVQNDLRIQANLSPSPPLRPTLVLQKEAAELLLMHFGDAAGPMRIDALPNGQIVVAGPIDSVENKLAISRLFRQLSGCTGVINELVVQQELRYGQRLVLVTKDGSMAAMSKAPAAVDPFPLPEPYRSGAATVQQPSPSRPSLPLPTAFPSRSLEAHDGELRLPSVELVQLPSTPPPAAPKKVGAPDDALTAPKLPVKWSHPTESWESQMKTLDKLRTPPPAAAPKKAGPPLPIPIAGSVNPPANTSKKVEPAVPSKPSQANKDARSDFAAMHGASTPSAAWKRPGGSEQSEPPPPSATKNADSPRAAPPPSAPLISVPLRRWPPAYETRPQASPKGTPGVIVFDDPAPKPAPKPFGLSSRFIVLADLQHRVKSVCGWQARDVSVQMQNDGGILVKVKVPSLSVQDQLTKKILAIPDMTAPGVRLLMDVGP